MIAIFIGFVFVVGILAITFMSFIDHKPKHS